MDHAEVYHDKHRQFNHSRHHKGVHESSSARDAVEAHREVANRSSHSYKEPCEDLDIEKPVA